MLFDFAEAGVEAGGRLHDLGTDFAAGTVEKADHGVDGLITFTDASVETCKDMSYLGKRLHGKAMERCRRVELVIGGIAHATRHGAEAAGRAYAAHREHENALRVQARLRAGRCSRMSEGVAK